MKILHVFDHSLPIQDGYSYRSRAILANQRALGWETVQVTGSKHVTTVAWEEAGGLGFYRTPPVNGVAARFPILGQLQVVTRLRRRVCELVRQERPDLIHAHSPSLNGLAALSVARRTHIPFVYEVRAFWEDAAVDHGTAREGGLRYRLTAASESYVLHRADAVTTIAEGLRREIVKRGVPAERVTVVGNGVETDVPIPDPAGVERMRRDLGLGGKFVLGFIGSFYAWEGLDILLSAYPLLAREVPEAEVLLVGGGQEDSALRALARDLGIESHVRFTGRVPHDTVDQYYALMDLTCFPRKAIRLTELVTPLKPLEAMARGRVCVASDVGGHRELIRSGETGFLFGAGDERDLARIVTSLAARREALGPVIEAARRFVESERTWKASVARYVPIYEALVGARAAVAHPARA
jgi:PEP-CTERM/exosortase A-associated glycosyltransferase